MTRWIAMLVRWFHRLRRFMMSEPSITKGHPHVSFASQSLAPADPSPVPLAPPDMILRFSEGRQLSVHLAKEPCSALVRELLMALVGLCNFGGTVNTPNRAELYTISIRKFVRFLAARSSPQECTLTVSDLTPRDGYSGQITDALRAACLKDIPQVTERLTVQCNQQCASGGDPEVHGWEN